jgi:hypothetical protein
MSYAEMLKAQNEELIEMLERMVNVTEVAGLGDLSTPTLARLVIAKAKVIAEAEEKV